MKNTFYPENVEEKEVLKDSFSNSAENSTGVVNTQNNNYETFKTMTVQTINNIRNIDWRKDIFPKPRDTRPSFLEEYPDLIKRKKLSQEIFKQFPNYIPIILERDEKSFLGPIKKRKFVIPVDYSTGSFLFMIRKYIPNLNTYETIFLCAYTPFNDKKMILNAGISLTTMGDIYQKMKNEDDFLYIRYFEENVFG